MSGIDNMGIVNADHRHLRIHELALRALYSREPASRARRCRCRYEDDGRDQDVPHAPQSGGPSGSAHADQEFASFFPWVRELHHRRVHSEDQSVGGSPASRTSRSRCRRTSSSTTCSALCDFKMAREVDVATAGTEFILGVRATRRGKSSPLKGLIHYVYYLSGTVYSSGRPVSQRLRGREREGGWRFAEAPSTPSSTRSFRETRTCVGRAMPADATDQALTSAVGSPCQTM